MTRLILALALVFTACATTGAAQESLNPSPSKLPVLHPAPGRTLQIVDVIGNNMQAKIFKMALMALESNEPIYLLINSPGGYVSSGEEFMQAMAKMQSRGLVIKCIANEAASMAMYIFDACSERYVVPSARLLWHPVKAVIREPISSRIADELSAELKRTDDYYRFPMIKHLNVDEESFEKARWEERWWNVSQLMEYSPNYMTPIAGFVGVDWDKPEENPFNLLVQPKKNYVLYN